MNLSRRQILKTAAAALVAAPALLPRAARAAEQAARTRGAGPRAPVTVPNGATLPFRRVDGIKVFHLVAEEIDHEFAPGLRARCWGYNGRTPGPVIEAVEGDRIRVYLTNRLAEPTTVHWHGLLIPSGMDGVAGLSQAAVRPGETFRYEFTLRQHGTFMYHPHADEMTQMALGMVGMMVVHPRDPGHREVDRDFSLMVHEWRVDPGAARPDPGEMTDFNVLTFNSKAYPGTDPLVVGTGERVRIRLGNLGAMEHHPIHLHGYYFRLTATEGGEIAEDAQWPLTTVLVPVGTTRTIEFVADNPGDWAFHCHMTHHAMNQMGHGLPNLVGVDTSKVDAELRRQIPGYMSMSAGGMSGMGEMAMAVPKNSIPMKGSAGPHGTIDMGGMFTILKVRPAGDASNWYASPPEETARTATADEMRADLGADAPRPG
jgi:FtsP/CotA-like multicopper oxidase with cupredoxin domain